MTRRLVLSALFLALALSARGLQEAPPIDRHDQPVNQDELFYVGSPVYVYPEKPGDIELPPDPDPVVGVDVFSVSSGGAPDGYLTLERRSSGMVSRVIWGYRREMEP